MKKTKETNGITLIALVITIIVLLILAGISIMMLTGENSILNRAGQASESSRESTEAEQVNLAVMAALSDATIKTQNGIQKDKLEEELGKYFSGATVSEDGDDYIYEGEYKTYRISKDGTVVEEEKDNSSLSVKLKLSYKNEPITADGAKVREVTDENIPIPVGFYKVGGTKSTGLVISDVADDDMNNTKGGNQFVWVPVNQGQILTLTVKTDETINSIKLTRPDLTEEDITSGGKKQEISMKNGDVYLNGIYTVKVTTTKSTQIAQTTITTLYGQDYTQQQLQLEEGIEQIVNMLKEQAEETYSTTAELLEAKSKNSVEELLTDASQDNMVMYMYTTKVYIEDQEESVREFMTSNGGGISIYTDNSQQQESVETYGGFYIARFEAGDASAISSERPYTSGTSGKVVSKKGAYVYNYVTREEAISLASEMIPGKTQLISGAGWDRTLNWIIETNNGLGENEVFINSSTWGNYSDSTGDAATNSGTMQTTGKNDAWRANNIYDLAGNTSEWTNELKKVSYDRYVYRGGSTASDGGQEAASLRIDELSSFRVHYVSFRVSLYL